MKIVRVVVGCLLAVMVIAVAWRTARTRAFHQARQRVAARQVAAAPPSVAPVASVQRTIGSLPSNPATATAAGVAKEKVTEERLGPFTISGNNYTVVLHKKHLTASADAAVSEADGVVAMEIVDAAGTVLYRRTFPLWADAESTSAWRIFAHTLSGTNGTGLLLRSSPYIDPSDPESKASYDQIFGVVNGKFVPFSGPLSGMVGNPDASGVYRTAGVLAPQADELRLMRGMGRFVIAVPIRLDWAQGKLSLAPKQCPEMAAASTHTMCQYELLDPNAFLKRPKDVTFVRLYSSPDEHAGRPERVVVKPASQIEMLGYRVEMEMKQPDASRPPSPTEFVVKDMVQIGIVPNTESWLQVRIDGKVGWIHTDEDLTAIGLPEPEDEQP